MNGNGAQCTVALEARHDQQQPAAPQYLQFNQSPSSPFSSINPEVNIELSGVKEPIHEWTTDRAISSISSPGFGVTVSNSPTVVNNNNKNNGNNHTSTVALQQTSESQMLKNRKVFIQRDYSLGTIVQFQNKFPVELEGLVERAQFEHLIQKVNEIFQEAESLSGRTVLKNCMACMTAFLLYGCMESEYDRCMRRLRQFLEQQNALVWNPRGLTVTDPTERGLRVMEIHM